MFVCVGCVFLECMCRHVCGITVFVYGVCVKWVFVWSVCLFVWSVCVCVYVYVVAGGGELLPHICYTTQQEGEGGAEGWRRRRRR